MRGNVALGHTHTHNHRESIAEMRKDNEQGQRSSGRGQLKARAGRGRACHLITDTKHNGKRRQRGQDSRAKQQTADVYNYTHTH